MERDEQRKRAYFDVPHTLDYIVIEIGENSTIRIVLVSKYFLRFF